MRVQFHMQRVWTMIMIACDTLAIYTIHHSNTAKRDHFTRPALARATSSYPDLRDLLYLTTRSV